MNKSEAIFTERQVKIVYPDAHIIEFKEFYRVMQGDKILGSGSWPHQAWQSAFRNILSAKTK